MSTRQVNRYAAIVERIFFSKYNAYQKQAEIPFEREDLSKAADALDIQLPKNLGDVIYSIRYRMSLPQSILDTQPPKRQWIIEGRGRSKYCFRLVPVSRLLPNENLIAIKIPDATPEIVSCHALSDEQALLAKVRYNRLIDIFLGLATYSLQNHLRTTVKDVGQVEIDEIYVGVDKNGVQFVLPVQAKGGSDQLSVVQTAQDIACCKEKFQNLVCRALSAQFIADDLIALFELSSLDDSIGVVDEKHYKLVPCDQISKEDLKVYNRR